MPRAALLVLLAAAWLPACARRQPTATGGAAALLRNLAQATAVEVHVEEDAAAEPLRRLAARERVRTGQDVRVLLRSPGDPSAARIVVGSLASGAVRALAARAGIATRLDPAPAFALGPQTHDGPADALRATFEDPERPGLPVTLWLGNDLELLLRQIEDLAPRARPWVDGFRRGEPSASGPLELSGALVPGALQRIALARVGLRAAPAETEPVEGLEVEAPQSVPAGDVAGVVAAERAARARAREWAGDALDGTTVHLRVLAEAADLRLGGEEHALARWNRALPACEVLVVAGVHDGGAAATRARLRDALGPAVEPWLEEAASVDAARTWWGRDLERWLARLAHGGALLRAADCVDPRSDGRLSPHVLAPTRAALFAFLRASRGDAFVRELWAGTRALDVGPELEARFEAAWRARVAPLTPEIEHRTAQRRALALAAPPLAGLGLVESDADPRLGLGSGRALGALAAWRARGAQGIALGLTFLAGADPRAPAPELAPLGPREGDVGPFVTALAARNGGLRVALQVAVVTSDGGTYAANWAPADEAGWDALFAAHARRVEHAALLADLIGADVLVLGTGMRAVSGAADAGRRARAGEEVWRRDGWRRVLGAARGAFGGVLTYGATGAEEAERIGFWSDLDCVGAVVCPPAPAARSAQPRAELADALRRELAACAAVAARAGRPLALTRVALPALAPERGSLPEEAFVGTLALLEQALAAVPVELRAAWLWGAGTDADGAEARALDVAARGAASGAALARWFAAPAGWVRSASPAGPRSPR